MERKRFPSAEELVVSVDSILKKEYDESTRIRFLFGLLKVLEKDPEKFKDALLERMEKLL